jgi:hypothetical protein
MHDDPTHAPTGLWRLLILDLDDPADPRWLIATVTDPADVRSAEDGDADGEPGEATREWAASRHAYPRLELTALPSARCWPLDAG